MQQFGKLICRIGAATCSKDRPQYNPGTGHSVMSGKSNEKEPNRESGHEEKSILWKRAFAGKVESRNNKKEEESIKEGEKQLFRTGG